MVHVSACRGMLPIRRLLMPRVPAAFHAPAHPIHVVLL